MELVEGEDGKVFPKAMKAGVVLDKLLEEARANGFEIIGGEKIVKVRREGNSDLYKLTSSQGKEFYGRKIVVATGGKSYLKTGSAGEIFPALKDLGLELEDMKPALTPIYVENYPYHNLAGISFPEVEITILKEGKRYKEKSSLLLAHSYFSGFGILNLSRYGEESSRLKIDYCPDIDWEELNFKIKTLKKLDKAGVLAVHDHLLRDKNILKRFLETLFLRLGLNKNMRLLDISGDDIRGLVCLLKEDIFEVEKTGDFNKAMVTAGGVCLEEIDLGSYEVKKYPGIYIIGEALAIDGDTGGYNMQFAFSSAWAANLDLEKS